MKKGLQRSAIILAVVLILAGVFPVCPVRAGEKYQGGWNFKADLYYDTLEMCVMQIRQKTDFQPDIVLVLGSGLGDFADKIKVETEIPYSEIIGFPVSTVPGHEGKLIFGTYAGKKLAVMKGRVHYYEGYSMYDVTLPIRVLGMLGAKTAILTNAVGSLNPDFKTGEFVVIEDHISSFVPSPLIGENVSELGERFTDMTHVYDENLRELALSIGKEKDIPIHSGIFLQVTGPQFETPAEIRMYRSFGADTISMSTAVEAIVARHMGMKVCGISCVSNMAAGMEEEELSHDLVNRNADKVTDDFTRLIRTLIEKMDTTPEKKE